MEVVRSIAEQILDLDAKALYHEDIGRDAADRKYWSLARYARNEASIARANIRGLKSALYAMNDCSRETNG